MVPSRLRSHHRHGILGGALSLALLAPALPTLATSAAVPQGPPGGTAPGTHASGGVALHAGPAHRGERPGAPQGYPRQQVLDEPAANESDAAIKLGLMPYHQIAPELNRLQEASDRVSAEVIGQSAEGRDLYLVTLTAPESRGHARVQELMKNRIKDDAAQAARSGSIPRHYKTPIFINNNIHGNEWEGTDAAMRLISEYATSDDPTIEQTLDTSRIYVVVTMNPDGRVNNTRANSNGFDMNRDFITATQPEVRAVREALIEAQPMVMLDLHGYVNGTLVEPTTPPHGENYEYDLFIKHAYPNGLGMEQAILDLGYTPEEDGVDPPQIPFRDWEEGWDDWPPIFTPQYAAYHGAASHTIEFPLRVNNREYDRQPVEELRRRSAINTDIAHAAMTASIDYLTTEREELIADQIEVFRRGAAGEEQRPVGPDLFPELGPEDVYLTEFPRAYVVPAGDEQRSAPAAGRLVDHLVANDVDVTRAEQPFTAGGTAYPAGSYVVDMHQPKRGMANVILGPGTDISDRVDSMYDISGWSHGLLWGADVDTVEAGQLQVGGTEVTEADPTGEVRARPNMLLRLDDPADFQALNALLDADAELEWMDDGTVLVPAQARRDASRAADEYGAVFTPAGRVSGEPIDEVVVAAAAASEERWALDEMGFEVRMVSTQTLNDGFDWEDVDSLYVSGGLDYTDLASDARDALDAFLDDGGGVVTQGRTGAAFNKDADLLEVEALSGRWDANGVVRVDNTGGPVTAGAPEHGFVYSPTWFTGLGEEVEVAQRYADEGPLVSGHWRPNSSGVGGQQDAQGQPVVVQGVDETSAGVVMFGSEPLFRAHPKGQYAQVGRALLWADLQDE